MVLSEERALLVKQGVCLIGFAGLNIALNFYNSWALKDTSHFKEHGPSFVFPVFYSTFHMVASALGALLIMVFNKPSSGYPSPSQFWDYKWELIPIAACTTVNIVCNNYSLTLVSLFLNQVIKATGPLPTMVFSALLERKTYGWQMVLTCGAIVAGTILAIPIVSGGSPTSGVGVVLVIASTAAASLKPVVMALVFQGSDTKPKLAPTSVLFYDSFISFWFMLIFWLCRATEREGSIKYLEERPAVAIGIIAGGATMAFLFNLSAYFFVKFTSALTSTVAANGVKVVNIVISAVTSSLSDVRNWLGVALVCLSLCLYAYLGHLAKQGKLAAAALPLPFWKGSATKDGLLGKASEDTPLKSPPDASAQCCTIS